MSKATKYGVKVSTWGTHLDAGNGMLHFLDAKLFGGNVGHAIITMTLPAEDPNTKALIEKYCTDPEISFTKKKIIVQQAVLDPLTRKQKKGKTVAHKEEVYEVYFSWWGPSAQDRKEGRYYNLQKIYLKIAEMNEKE